jgi:two-component system, NtrC family, response regulator AtoC
VWRFLILQETGDSSLATLTKAITSLQSSLVTVETPQDFAALLRKEHFDSLLIPLREAITHFEDFLQQEIFSVTPIPLLIAYGHDHERNLQAIRNGVYEVISLSSSTDMLVWQLQQMFARSDMYPSHPRIAPRLQQRKSSSTHLVIKSPQMKEIFDKARRLAAYSTTVLITGESGTGKELIAKEIHSHSARRDQPFIAINCGAIPESLMESELFGHRKGSFTDALRDKKGLFEEADNGTIFLDEIGEMPLHLQVKLLRVLQEQALRRVGDDVLRPIDVRVVAATLRDLESDVKEGRFRDDLYYRLNVVSLSIPPLRERQDEIEPLIRTFMRKHNSRLGLRVKEIVPEALHLLKGHVWRGNVRELENCIERAMVLSESGKIDLSSLPEHLIKDSEKISVSDKSISLDTYSIKKKTRELEIALMTKALKKTGGNRTQAAKLLDISHRALLYKLKEYNISS